MLGVEIFFKVGTEFCSWCCWLQLRTLELRDGKARLNMTWQSCFPFILPKPALARPHPPSSPSLRCSCIFMLAEVDRLADSLPFRACHQRLVIGCQSSAH